VSAGIFGLFTSVSMIGPLLLDIAREFDVSLGQAGLLATVTAVPWALASPFAGVVSDRLGRRPLVVLALGGVGALCLGASMAGSFIVLGLTRFAAGLVGACGPTSLMASVGDLFPPERRARAMGWFNMGFSLAAVIGVPALGAVGGILGWRWAFVTAGVALLLLALLVRLAFPAPALEETETSVLVTYRAVLRIPRLASVLAANLLERSMFGTMFLYLPAFLMLRYRLGAAEVAPMLSVVAVGAVGGNVFGGWVGDRVLKPAVFVAGQVVAAGLGLALFGLALPLAGATLLAALFGLANASSRPAFLAFGSELAPRHRGALFGLVGLTNQGGLVLGSALGGLVIELGGYTTLAIVMALQGGLAAAVAVPLVARGEGAAPFGDSAP
jgi:YNFM family putative membrane transporter